jgi:putative lipoprotein
MAKIGLAVAMILLAASCSAGGGGPSLWGTKWVATSIAGQPVRPPGRVTLSFADGRVSGNGGCNSFGGEVKISGGTLSWGGLAATRMACMEDGLMQQESAYLLLLERTVRFELQSGGGLALFAADGSSIAFQPASAP